MTELDERMMQRALKLAGNAAAEGEVPVGAVIYRGEEIIAEGWNLREATNDPTAHAELLAMSRAGQALGEWRLNDCSLAVTLEPCPMCAGAMVNARLGRVIYGARDPKAGACDTLFSIPIDPRLNHRVTVVGGVQEEACGDVLREFFRARRAENKKRKQAERAGGAARSSGSGGGCRRCG
ncbi:MAG: tRNA adenosine(34) deaminase TadA [Phycisphaerales bacterium]